MIGVGIDVSKNKSTITAMRDIGEIVMIPHEIKHNHVELDKHAKRIITQH